jgi:chaperonin GroEL
LAEALVKGGLHLDDANKTDVLRELKALTDGVIEELRSRSRRLTKKQLKHVATISANNDKAIGDIIANVYKDVGKDGIVTVERSQTSETGFKTTHGIRVERGWSSPMFINDQSRDECVFEGCKVLVCDTEIGNVLSIEKVLAPIIREGGSGQRACVEHACCQCSQEGTEGLRCSSSELWVSPARAYARLGCGCGCGVLLGEDGRRLEPDGS